MNNNDWGHRAAQDAARRAQEQMRHHAATTKTGQPAGPRRKPWWKLW